MSTELQTPPESSTRPPMTRVSWLWFIIAGIFTVMAIRSISLRSQVVSENSQAPKPTWVSFSRPVNGLTSDSLGQVWVVDSKSITRFSADLEQASYPLPPEMDCQWYCLLAVDDQGQVWVSGRDTQREGIIARQDANGQWTKYTPEDEYAKELIFELVVDGKGRAWVKSLEQLGMIDPNVEKTTYSLNNPGLPDQKVNAITVDDQGHVWVEAGNQILMLEAGDHWMVVNERNDCTRGCPWGSALAVDHQGQVWRGSYTGVSLLRENGIWEAYPLGDPKVSLEIQHIIADTKNRIWAYTSQQIFVFDPETGWKEPSTAYFGLPHLRLSDFILDKQDRVWIVSEDGADVVLSVSSDIEKMLETETIQNDFQKDTQSSGRNAGISGLVAVVFTSLGILNVITHQNKLPSINYLTFLLCFFGWFAIHAVFWKVYAASGPGLGGVIWMSLLVPLVNMGILVWLYKAKRWLVFCGVFTALLGNIVATWLEVGTLSFFGITVPYFMYFL